MWVQAGFPPDMFWGQTPRHYQLAMRGVRKRLERERDARTGQAYETGVFSGLAHHAKLKRLDHYLATPKVQTPAQMVAVLRSLGAKSNMTITRIRRDG